MSPVNDGNLYANIVYTAFGQHLISVFLSSFSKNLLAFYHECRSLIGYATQHLFCFSSGGSGGNSSSGSSSSSSSSGSSSSKL